MTINQSQPDTILVHHSQGNRGRPNEENIFISVVEQNIVRQFFFAVRNALQDQASEQFNNFELLFGHEFKEFSDIVKADAPKSVFSHF